jgi:succinyl-CoA synthetase alpha subunit/RimJ/RimL family protein N-acetyltransferase
MTPVPVAADNDVGLKDGSTVLVRSIHSEDRAAVRALMGGLSKESLYFRFFTTPRSLDPEVDRLLGGDGVQRAAIVAELGGRLVGIASYVRNPDQPQRADVAFVVSDEHQGHGIGTRLLTALAERARSNRISRFEADVLCSNLRMLQVFQDVGFRQHQKVEAGVCHVSLDLSASADAEAQSIMRARTSACASMRAFFEPRAVVVVGASRQRGKIGAEVLHNLIASGYTGRLAAVHPSAREIEGVPAYPRVGAIPEAPDLAVICIPAPDVRPAVADCIKAGVKAVVVLTAGFGETGEAGRALERELLDDVRRGGIRMVGPNCMGVLNTAAGVHLNATFSPVMPPPGRVAMLSQSGALGLAILEHARRLQIGLSTFVSVGNKADVSGNDLLQYWEQDANTESSCCTSRASAIRASSARSRAGSRAGNRSSPSRPADRESARGPPPPTRARWPRATPSWTRCFSSAA